MESATMNNTDFNAVTVKIAVDAWHMQMGRISKLIDGLTDEQLAADTAPGRNSGYYLLGHLTAVNDRLIDMFGWGARLHPELDEPFLFKPDKNDLPKPAIGELRSYWSEINAVVNTHIESMTAAAWFERHNAVTAEDFAKEPHRNKLNVLVSRAIHASNHLGQMTYLQPKA